MSLDYLHQVPMPSTTLVVGLPAYTSSQPDDDRTRATVWAVRIEELRQLEADDEFTPPSAEAWEALADLLKKLDDAGFDTDTLSIFQLRDGTLEAAQDAGLTRTTVALHPDQQVRIRFVNAEDGSAMELTAPDLTTVARALAIS